MSKRVDSLSGQIAEQEQYSRLTCLLLHGIPEDKNEKTDYFCIATINERLELSITEAYIERTHRIEKLRDSSQKLRPIIVIFVKYNDKKNVFNRKKKIKSGEYYGQFNSNSKEARKIYDFKMFGHQMGKSYLRMDQEIQVYFMINPDLVDSGRGLHYEKRNIFYLFCLYLGSWIPHFLVTFCF